jgi:hypothetical protein
MDMPFPAVLSLLLQKRERERERGRDGFVNFATAWENTNMVVCRSMSTWFL